MPYDFDTIITRPDSTSAKWGMRQQLFGSNDVIPMWVADMDFKSAPPIIEALQQRIAHGIFGYAFPAESFYQAIVSWLTRHFQWPINSSMICYSPTVVQSLIISILAYSKPGDKIIIQQPVYYPFPEIVLRNQRTLINNNLLFDGKNYYFNFDELEQQLRTGVKILILCSPHNPVGRVWSCEELKRLGELCVKYGTIIVSDEIHADIIFPGHKHIPLASISADIAAHTITCMSVSKSFNLPGLQTSYVVITNPTLKKLFDEELMRAHAFIPNNVGVVGLETAYTHGETWLQELLIYLQKNIECVNNFFRNNFPQIQILPTEGTYLMWLNCQAMKKTQDQLKQFFYQQAKVGLEDGCKYGPSGTGFMRMNVACPRSLLMESLDRISEAMKVL